MYINSNNFKIQYKGLDPRLWRKILIPIYYTQVIDIIFLLILIITFAYIQMIIIYSNMTVIYNIKLIIVKLVK